MSVSHLRVLSESSAPLVIVHEAKHCALQVDLFPFYPLTFDEVVCVYNLKYVAKKPPHFLLALFQNLLASPPPPECVGIQYVCVRVCVCVCVCVFACARVTRHSLYCSQRLNFKRIKNTPDSPARIINHHTQDVCLCVFVCV